MDWRNYDHYHPLVLGLPSEMSRRDALNEYANLIALRGERITAILKLLEQNGAKKAGDVNFISSVNAWFVQNVERGSEDPMYPAPLWYAVIKDLGLLLGESMISQHETLHWDFAKWGGKRSPSFQRHVVAGFPPEGANIFFDTDLRLAAYGTAVVRGEPTDPNQFSIWLAQADSMATATY